MFGVNQRGRAIEDVRQFGIGQRHQQCEDEDQMHEVGDMPVRLQPEIVQHLGGEAGDYHHKQQRDERPIPKAAGAGSLAVSHAIEDHQRATGQDGDAARIGEHLPWIEEGEGINEVSIDERVDPGGNHPERDQAQRQESVEHTRVRPEAQACLLTFAEPLVCYDAFQHR